MKTQLRKLNYYLIAENNDWGKLDVIRRVLVDIVHRMLDIRFIYYRNSIQRKAAIKVMFTKDCIVLMLRKFDLSFWWGDSYQDMDYSK